MRYLLILAILLALPVVYAAADFDVNTFSCTPSEVAVNDVFSCTAQIKNNGDASGTLNEVRLYPDSNNWLEQSNYLQTSGASVSAGQSTEVIFSSMRATRAGNNGFARISLDNEDDLYVSNNNVKENVIDATLVVTSSVSSAAMGATFTSTPEITAGGNIDVTLTMAITSGGCSIGNQNSQKSTSGLTNSQKWTPSSWTITQGTSGDCKYTISAAVTGSSGIASKIVSLAKTITCTDCPTPSGSSTSGSNKGGGGAGGGASANASELTEATTKELSAQEPYDFAFGGETHSVTVLNMNETTATIRIKSEEKIITLTVGEERSIDFENDGKNDISVKLVSINIITKRAKLLITPLYRAVVPAGNITSAPETPATPEKSNSGPTAEEINNFIKSPAGISVSVIIALLVVAFAVSFAARHGWLTHKESTLKRSVVLKRFTTSK